MSQSDVLKSYAGPPAAGKPGELEGWAMIQAAIRLKDASESGDNETIMAAVRLNWRMWTIFQAELLDPACEVPMDIRGNLLSLANFIDKHTVAFIADPQPRMLEILISINRDLSAGLFASPPPEEQGAQPDAAASAPIPPPPAAPPGAPDPAAEPAPGNDPTQPTTSVKISV
jgi:flagellar biosynthesis activator protein FlaF